MKFAPRQLTRGPWYRTWALIVLAAYLVLVATGVTTSSVGISSLQDDEATRAHGLVAYQPQLIRTDEYLRATPWTLGFIRSGGDDFATPLAYDDPAVVTRGTGGVSTVILFPDSVLTQLIGDTFLENVFAFVWWLPVVLVLLLLPLWFRQLGVAARFALPLTLIAVLSPVVPWWSWSSLGPLCWTLLCAVAAGSGVARWRLRGPHIVATLLLVLASLGMARMALSYQPWAIPMAGVVLLPTLLQCVSPGPRRLAGVLLPAAVTVVGGIAFGAFLHEHSRALQILTTSEYPGTRRFTGKLMEIGQLFGAPHLHSMGSQQITDTNQSEIASGYLLLALVVVVLLPLIAWRRLEGRRGVTVAALAPLAFFASWCLADWPSFGTSIFPMNLIAPDRIAQILGLLATLVFGLVLTAWTTARHGSRLTTAITAGCVVLLVTVLAGSDLRHHNLPGIETESVAIASVLAALAVSVALYFADRWWCLVPAVILAAYVVSDAAPVQAGLGDLESGRAARTVQRFDERLRDGELWAADDIYGDALLMANAANSLSGQQWVGPDERSWRVFDPRAKERTSWDRGASYVTFRWTGAGTSPRIELPAPDNIEVHVDPCGDEFRRFHVRLLLTAQELDRPCLARLDEEGFGGKMRYVYEVSATGSRA